MAGNKAADYTRFGSTLWVCPASLSASSQNLSVCGRAKRGESVGAQGRDHALDSEKAGAEMPVEKESSAQMYGIGMLLVRICDEMKGTKLKKERFLIK